MTAAPTTDEKLGLLADHYRESFAHQRDYLKRRDRLFVYALTAAVALVVRASDGEMSERVLKLAIEKLLGPTANIDACLLGVILWFVFFAVVARYFQASLTVQRQYEYIGRVESEITLLYGNDVLAREGAAYFLRYPAFSSWMDVVYSWGFPGAMVVLTVVTCVADVRRAGAGHGTSVMIIALAVCVCVTVALYTYSTKFEDRPKTPMLAAVPSAQEAA